MNPPASGASTVSARTIAQRFRRLPALARVGLFLVGAMSVSLLWCALLLAALRPGWDVFTFPDRYPLAASAYLAGTYVILVGGALWTWRKLQGETLRSLGLAADRPLAALALGLALGLGSLGSLFGLEIAAGLLQWDAAAWQATPLVVLLTNGLTALFFGFSEELIFRGYLFQTMRRGLSLPIAMAASAYLYAQVHFLRFDLQWHTVLMPFTGLFLAGLVLAWAAHRTRGIWVSAGLHAAWVYLFFLTDRQKLLVYPIQHNWLTGGGYPLAGWLGLAMLGLLGLGLAIALAPPGRPRPGAGARPVAIGAVRT